MLNTICYTWLFMLIVNYKRYSSSSYNCDFLFIVIFCAFFPTEGPTEGHCKLP